MYDVVELGTKARTQNGHGKNDTRDASRRILESLIRLDLQEELCRA